MYLEDLSSGKWMQNCVVAICKKRLTNKTKYNVKGSRIIKRKCQMLTCSRLQGNWWTSYNDSIQTNKGYGIDMAITWPPIPYRSVVSIVTFSTSLLRPFNLFVPFIFSIHNCLQAGLTWINWDAIISDNILMRIEVGTWKWFPVLLHEWTCTEPTAFLKEIHVNQTWFATLAKSRIFFERRKSIGGHKCVGIFANTGYGCLFFTSYLNEGISVCRLVERGTRDTRGWMTKKEFPVNIVFQYISGCTGFIWVPLARFCVSTADYQSLDLSKMFP